MGGHSTGCLENLELSNMFGEPLMEIMQVQIKAPPKSNYFNYNSILNFKGVDNE